MDSHIWNMNGSCSTSIPRQRKAFFRQRSSCHQPVTHELVHEIVSVVIGICVIRPHLSDNVIDRCSTSVDRSQNGLHGLEKSQPTLRHGDADPVQTGIYKP